jgi:hypothetical protein
MTLPRPDFAVHRSFRNRPARPRLPRHPRRTAPEVVPRMRRLSRKSSRSHARSSPSGVRKEPRRLVLLQIQLCPLPDQRIPVQAVWVELVGSRRVSMLMWTAFHALYENRSINSTSVLALPLVFIVLAVATRIAPDHWIEGDEQRRTHSLRMYWNCVYFEPVLATAELTSHSQASRHHGHSGQGGESAAGGDPHCREWPRNGTSSRAHVADRTLPRSHARTASRRGMVRIPRGYHHGSGHWTAS